MILPTIPTRTDLATRASAAMAAIPNAMTRKKLADAHALLTSDCPLMLCIMTGVREEVECAEAAIERMKQ